MITLESLEELTEDVIRRIVDNHKMTELPRMLLLENYYHNNNKINQRVMADPSKPNNKVANAYASYITDILTGYFLGSPISYNCEDKQLLESLNNILEYNDEADENSELAKDMSIYGVGYEMLYMSDNMLRFKRLDPKQIIPIFDKTIEENLLCVLRYYDDYNYFEDRNYTIVEVIDSNNITRYKIGQGVVNTTSTSFMFLDQEPHFFGMVPVAIFENNEDREGDYEKVIPLIDAYDRMESNSLNDFDYFTDCYLVFKGVMAEDSDLADMKQKRVILLDNDSDAEWLTKQGDDSSVESMKNRLDQDIHKFSKCPNLSDKEFAGNSSGVAIKFKMLGTEDLISIKERKFKKGIQQRFELMSQITSLLGSSFDWRTIDIIFTRNLPASENDIANMVKSLEDIVSDETLLAQIPFVENVEAELEKVKKQKEDNKELSPFFSSGLDYKTGAMKNEKEQVPEV